MSLKWKYIKLPIVVILKKLPVSWIQGLTAAFQPGFTAAAASEEHQKTHSANGQGKQRFKQYMLQAEPCLMNPPFNLPSIQKSGGWHVLWMDYFWQRYTFEYFLYKAELATTLFSS